MRPIVKYRLLFLAFAIVLFTIGVQLTPESLATANDELRLSLIAIGYFGLIPLAYWYCIIKKGSQKWWKLIIILSTSSLVARLSFPADIADYFEFVAWLKYPIIGVLLIIESFLVFTIIRGLLKVRKVKGDPRVSAVEVYADEDEKALSIAFIVAGEPTNWYYAIPWFSRNHPTGISHIKLLSAKPWHLSLMLSGCLTSCVASYMILVNWSELAAIIVSSIISLTLVMLVANYRISRRYSMYRIRNRLVVNNAIWGFMAIDINEIETVAVNQATKKVVDDELSIGRGEQTNLTIRFKTPQWYFGGLGQLVEKLTVVHINVAEPEKVVAALTDIEQSEAA
ncbi:hypothetical protein [Shewanella sp. 10N.286.48.B5]|uniref:hypothetical protein n=1 Tax=Shewanella sp. 10N.286.48.B5 TaxID=1880834 RepID=UPI000C820E18|nr:hypothetical protein [Shewanella sp. 10N.286.48.B5]PMH87953.1 hypothetical protein BCU57_04915 [Shewanella sp. 10N.286.48.B5]